MSEKKRNLERRSRVFFGGTDFFETHIIPEFTVSFKSFRPRQRDAWGLCGDCEKDWVCYNCEERIEEKEKFSDDALCDKCGEDDVEIHLKFGYCKSCRFI